MTPGGKNWIEQVIQKTMAAVQVQVECTSTQKSRIIFYNVTNYHWQIEDEDYGGDGSLDGADFEVWVID